MRNFVLIITMLLFVVVSNASPPPDPVITFDSGACMVIQDDTNVDLFSFEAQEVAYHVIYYSREYGQIIDFKVIKNSMHWHISDVIYIKPPLYATISFQFKVPRSKQHQNWGYPFTAN